MKHKKNLIIFSLTVAITISLPIHAMKLSSDSDSSSSSSSDYYDGHYEGTLLQLISTTDQSPSLSNEQLIASMSSAIAATQKQNFISSFANYFSNENNLDNAAIKIFTAISPFILKQKINDQLLPKLYQQNKSFKEAVDHFIPDVRREFITTTSETLKEVENLEKITTITELTILPTALQHFIKNKTYQETACSFNITHHIINKLYCFALHALTHQAAVSDKKHGLIIGNLNSLQKIYLSEDSPISLCFAPDGKSIAGIISNKKDQKVTIKEWDIATQKEIGDVIIDDQCNFITYTQNAPYFLSVLTLPTPKKIISNQYLIQNNDGNLQITHTIELPANIFIPNALKNHQRNSFGNPIKQECYTVEFVKNDYGKIIHVVMKCSDCKPYYLCHTAMENTTSTTELDEIKKSQSYAQLPDGQQRSINRRIERKKEDLNKNIPKTITFAPMNPSILY